MHFPWPLCDDERQVYRRVRRGSGPKLQQYLKLLAVIGKVYVKLKIGVALKHSQKNSAVEQYHSSGLALLVLGAVIMLSSSFYVLNDYSQSEYDHVSNFLLGLVVGLTGWWLRAHTEEDLSD